jgi:hypothetical protein
VLNAYAPAVGILAVDVTAHGVVMSADSQRVQILGGENRVQVTPGQRSRLPIVERLGGGFVGLVGFAGTEEIEEKKTAQWLRAFSAAHPEDDIADFCVGLAEDLTRAWNAEGLSSILEILVTGEVSGDVRFWYVRNSDGLRTTDWKHYDPLPEFHAENDLDMNYIPRDSVMGETKDELLRRAMYSFRQGVVIPAGPVFDAVGEIMESIYARKIEGFAPLSSLDDLGHYARVRMEFLKRLCSADYGIYDPQTPTPVDGVVHVRGVSRRGEIRKYVKGRQEVRTLRPGGTS